MQTDARFEITGEVKTQIKFLSELDSLERKRHEEVERGVLLRAAKVLNTRLTRVFLNALHCSSKVKQLRQGEELFCYV